MTGDATKQETTPGSKLSRRDFLKLILTGAAGLGILEVTNSALYRLLSQNIKKNIEFKNEDFPFGEFVDPGYPTVSWTRANLEIAVSLIDGQIIKAKEDFSLLNTLLPNPEKIQPDNTDPTKGFVYGPEVSNPLKHLAASGICKSATDIFRCALGSPIIIKEASTHNNIYPNHPYFINYPYGTDAAIFIDPENNVKYDLVLANPWDFPVKINYRLFDKTGKRIKPQGATGKLDLADYSIGLWIKYIEGMQQANIPVSKGAIPNLIGETWITSQVFFEPAINLSKKPNWKVEINGPTKLDNGQYEIKRKLFIEGNLADTYTRITNYH